MGQLLVGHVTASHRHVTGELQLRQLLHRTSLQKPHSISTTIYSTLRVLPSWKNCN
jgi:hypothetical protein